VKESLFGSLETDPAAPLDGTFLDLYAGSGAAGIEALSRGAPVALFVERDQGAVRAIGDNLRRAGVPGGHVVRANVLAWLAGPGIAEAPFRCAVVDPPYADSEALVRTLDTLGGPSGLVAPGGVVVCKHHWRWTGPEAAGVLVHERSKRFGETALTWYRAAPG
jgi:16S rRNA (guanine966-N2)-methyltransferase